MTSAVEKQPIQHTDKLGRSLNLGDCVAVSHFNTLMIATVTKINPKMIKVSRVGNGYRKEGGYLKYPNECVLLDGPDVTAYLLKTT